WAAKEPERLKKYRNRALVEAFEAMLEIGLPCIIRPSFTLGGTGGGIAYNKAEFLEIVETGLDASPTAEVLIEESVLGWKEYEMEVVRDKDDNCIIICSIENVDPMGVHTGDSITVAPALTLTDKEYQMMRNAAIAVLREIGVETGGSNVQFAVDPATGRLVVIEMNPRVSRSSALASKATGFPIAKIAAKLAVGYTLDELANDIRAALATPTPDRVLKVAQALRLGATVEQVHAACNYDPWFIREIGGIVSMEAKIRERGLPKDSVNLRRIKAMGFSDRRLAEL